MRPLLIIALAATLVGCSHQSPPQAAVPSCTGPNPLACLTAVTVPSRSNAETTEGEPAIAPQSEKSASANAHHAVLLAGTTAKSRIAAKSEAGSRILLPPAQNNLDRSNRLKTIARGNTAEAAPRSANNGDVLVAVLMVRPDIKSVSGLTGKTVAIDERYSASNGTVRTALVAAGAPQVQLRGGETTAMNRLVNREVPAAVLALVSSDTVESFPEIAGFRMFHIPLSPRSLKGRT